MLSGQSAVSFAQQRRIDVYTIVLIGVTHGTSHFFHLLLPPLFPWLIHSFGFNYAQLGVLVTVFFAVSGVGQALAGFVVDRVGAKPVLMGSMALFASAALSAALTTGYTGLVLAAALAGLGNAPLHPADFTVLNQRVSATRIGYAFAVHGISGNVGWALAPVFLTGIATLTGSWRGALVGAALLALSMLCVLYRYRSILEPALERVTVAATQAKAAQQTAAPHALAFLKLPALWLCFAFFFFSTCALSAIQSFAPAALHKLYHLATPVTSLVVTGYMLFGVVGMLIGGALVARLAHLERLIGAALLLAAGLLLLVSQPGLIDWTAAGGYMALLLTASAGFGTGLAGPSRDMLIKQAAPPGATGRVYGTVYSGLDLGFALSAPVLGAFLDHGQPSWVFISAALSLALGVVCATQVGWGITARRQAKV